MSKKCFGIAGWKNSGKTSLVASLVTEISNRGFVVSTIKHAHHAFDLDTPNTDSFKHREAGANEVVLVSGNRWAIQHELRGNPEPDFETVLEKLSPCDLILVEGYKRENIRKLEIIGPDCGRDRLWPNDPNILALACDEEVADCDLHRFARGDVSDIADFILETCGVGQ